MNIKTRKLGRTDLQVSELCLCTEGFGWSSEEPTAFAVLDDYHGAGGRFIQSVGFSPDGDAAESGDSPSEEWLGRWLQARAVARERIVLATRLNLVRPAYGRSIAFANRIRRCCEQSLRRLRTSHLDLLICEWDEQLGPVDDLIDAVDMLIRAGTVRYAVASGCPSWRIVDSLHRARVRNRCRFEALQLEYSLMARGRFETEALSMCREHRVGFLARSPLAGGFLGQHPPALSGGLVPEHRWLDERFGNPFGDATRAVLSAIAEKRSASPAQVAVAWVLRNLQVTSVVVSPTSSRELSDLVGAADLMLTDAEAVELADATAVQDYRMELRHV